MKEKGIQMYPGDDKNPRVKIVLVLMWIAKRMENFFNLPPSRSFFVHHIYIVYMVQNVSRMMEYYLRQSSGLIQAILELSWWSKSSYHNLALETNGYKRSIFGVFYSLMSIFLMNSMYRNKNVIVWQPLLVSEVTTNEFWCLRDVVIASNNSRWLPKIIFHDCWYILDHINNVCMM